MSQITNFSGVAKRNKYVVCAVIDKVGNMLIDNSGKIETILHIPEHDQRIDQFSMNQKFVIDNTMFEILGGQVPNKFTYLLDESHKYEPITVTKFCTKYRLSDLERIMRNHEMFKREQLFFMGGSNFLKEILPYIDMVMLTVIDHDFTNELTVIDKFPIAEYSKVLTKKTIDESELAAIYQKSSKGLRPSNREITILSEHIKMIKSIEKPKHVVKHFYKFVTFQ